MVLGIDPGVERTGFAVVNDLGRGKIKVYGFGLITTSKENNFSQRLRELHGDIEQVIKKYPIRVMAVERLFYSRNQKTIIEVSEARGVILLAAASCGLEICEYTPNEIKQSVTGYGAADKKQVEKMVKKILGINSIAGPDDVADALAVAVCGLQSNNLAILRERNEK